MINQSHTDGVSHRRARKLIQQGQLSLAEQSTLKAHFGRCDECRRYAAAHVYLSKHLQLKPVRMVAPPEIKASILRRVESQYRRSQIMKPINALAGLVIFAAVIFIAWQAINPRATQNLRPVIEEPPATKLSPALAQTTEAETAAAVASPIPIEESTESFQEYPIGIDIWGVTVADLNNDNYPDAAAADQDGDVIYLLFNNQEGAFEEIKEISVNEDPSSIAAADLNGDSDFDLAVGYASGNTISVLINNGDGTFQEPVSTFAGPQPQWVATGDLNRDSFIDLVVPNNPDSVGVLLNNGDGTFQDSQQYLAGGTAGRGWFSVGDLNGDAYPDLAANHFPGRKISILMNNGDGTFGEAADYEAEFGPRYITIADLNGDTYADLVVPSDNGMMSVFFNNRDGSFQERVIYEIGGAPFMAVVEDMDQDTYPDLMVGSTGVGTMSLFSNDGGGIFQFTKEYYFSSVFPRFFMVTDLDGDGNREVVTTDNSGDSSVYVLPIEGGVLKFR